MAKKSDSSKKGKGEFAKDKDVFALAADYKLIDAHIKKLSDEKKSIADSIMAEMKKRKIVSLAGEQWKITMTEGETVTFSLDEIQKQLTPALFKKVTVPALNKAAFLDLVNAGKIPAKVLKKVTDVQPKAPYITVTPQ